MALKRDAREVASFLDQLAASTWLGPSRADWPRFIYHFADLTNAVSIIKNGRILSRNQLDACNIGFSDCADREVIASSGWSHDYARLYFRPRTPTQYHMEGIRPENARRHGAHCPVPVFFLFDSKALLTREGCIFSNGNVAAPGHLTGDSADFLRKLDFRKIYHVGGVQADPRGLTFAKCAEVLFQDELSLEDLAAIVCRTAPERDTLLTLLGQDLANDWRHIIRVERQGEQLFNREWHYLRDIRLDNTTLYLDLSRVPDQRALQVRFRDRVTLRFDAPDQVVGTQEQYRLGRDDRLVAVEYKIFDSLAFNGFVSQKLLFRSG